MTYISDVTKMSKPGSSLLKRPVQVEPPLIDITDEDPGLEILTEIPAPRSGMGPYGGGLAGNRGLMGGLGNSYFPSTSVLSAQDPYTGGNPTDLLQKCKIHIYLLSLKFDT